MQGLQTLASVCSHSTCSVASPNKRDAEIRDERSFDCQVQFPAKAGCNCRGESRAYDKLILNLFLAEHLGRVGVRAGEGEEEA